VGKVMGDGMNRVHWDEMARIAYSEWYNNCRTDASTRVTRDDEHKLCRVVACALETAYEMAKVEQPKRRPTLAERLSPFFTRQFWS